MSKPTSAARVHSVALGCTVLSLVMIALSYLGAFVFGNATPWAAWLMALGTALLFSALTILGAARHDRPWRALALAVAFIFIVLVGAFGAALLLPPETAASPLVLGLPLRAAIVIYGIGILPAFVLPFVYARTFDSLTLSAEDLAQVKAAALRARAGMAK